MSFLGDLLKIVAIGAFFIATGPFGLAVSNTLATALRIGGMVIGYLGALADRPRLLAERQRLFISTTLEPNAPIPVIYGRAKVGAVVADWFLQPDRNYQELYYVAVFAHGSRDDLGVAGIDEIWLDGRKAINVTTGARSWPYKPITANYKVFLGSTVQNVGGTAFYTDGSGLGIESPANVAGSGWSATTDTGKGLCCVGFVFLNVDTATFNDTAITITSSSVANPTVILTASAHGFATGDAVRIQGHSGSTPDLNAQWVVTVTDSTHFTIPEVVTVGGSGGTVRRFSEGPAFNGPPAVSAIIRGNRVYDSRTDTWTAGGDNPAMCIRDFLLAPIYGGGFSQSLIHEQSFKDAATYCDVTVNYAVGTAVAISNSDAATERVNTSTAHGWATGQIVRIAGHTGATPALNGDHTITVTSSTSFTLDDVANITVGGTGGTVTKVTQAKRATCNGIVDTARPISDTLQELCSSCRGNLVWEQGQFKLTIRSPSVASPTFTISPANMVGQWSFRNAGLEEKWNLVTATYVEPANGEFKTQDVQWPLAGATNNYLTSDNSFTNQLQLSLPFTNDALIAQALAQITLNESRFGITAQCVCTEDALALSVGDRVYVTHPTPGWALKEFWVTSLSLLPNTTVAVSLQEYDATAYDLATITDRSTFVQERFTFQIPAPGAVTGSAISGGGLLISWVPATYGFTDYYEVEAKCFSCGDAYAPVPTTKGTYTAIAPLARAGQTWYARVRIVNTLGAIGPWSESSLITLPAVTGITPGTASLVLTGYAPTVVITTTAPDVTSASTVASGGDFCSNGEWTITVSWLTNGPDDAHYSTSIDVANDAAGVSYAALVSGLTTDDSSYIHSTGVSGNTGGTTSPTTYYRKYKVKIVRSSDSVVVDSTETGQETLTVYTDPCA